MPGEERQRPTSLAGFRVVSELGRGGMGVVYAGWDEKLLRRVALKLLAEELSSSADLRERFLREARASAALAHPNICTIHAIETCDDGRLLLVMELVDGRSLRARLVAGDLSRAAVRTIALGIAAALAKAHAVGIVHRDLKPENVMVGDDGTAKLLDFGIAKALARGPALDTAENALTGTGQVVGTAGYIAPEQIEGLEADQRVDVFAFGVVLFEMLGGVRPFEGATPVLRLVSVLRDAPSDLDALAPDVPPAVRALALRCLAKRAEDRPLDGATLVRELEAAWPPGAASTGSSAGMALPVLGTAPTEAHVDTPAARAGAARDLGTDPTEALNGHRQAPAAPSVATVPSHPVGVTAPGHPTATAPNGAASRRTPLYVGVFAALVLGGAVWASTRHDDATPPSSPASASASVGLTSAPSRDTTVPRASAPPSSRSRSPRSGRLPPEVIQTTVRDRFAAVGRCADFLGARATIRSVWFVIETDGTTRDVAVREMDLGMTEVDRCLVEVFSAMRFPRPEGGTITVTYPIHLADGGAELDGAACSAKAECLESGTCSLRNNQCVVATDGDCQLSRACAEWGACTAEKGTCRPRHTDCAPEAQACRRYGLCTTEGGVCRAATDDDCAGSLACGNHGLCSAVEGVCRAPSSAECAHSAACRDAGRCEESGGECSPGDATDCEGSLGCSGRGQCVLRAGTCVAERDEDCRKSVECKSQGRCKVGGTRRCIAGSDADCKASEACQSRGECKLGQGLCIPD
jgi:hypothetical protein